MKWSGTVFFLFFFFFETIKRDVLKAIPVLISSSGRLLLLPQVLQTQELHIIMLFTSRKLFIAVLALFAVSTVTAIPVAGPNQVQTGATHQQAKRQCYINPNGEQICIDSEKTHQKRQCYINEKGEQICINPKKTHQKRQCYINEKGEQICINPKETHQKRQCYINEKGEQICINPKKTHQKRQCYINEKGEQICINN